MERIEAGSVQHEDQLLGLPLLAPKHHEPLVVQNSGPMAKRISRSRTAKEGFVEIRASTISFSAFT